jgi:hypothetical protein
MSEKDCRRKNFFRRQSFEGIIKWLVLFLLLPKPLFNPDVLGV